MHSAVNTCGIPHLAKNERDMGRPDLRGQVEAAPDEIDYNRTLGLLAYKDATFLHGW